MNKKLKKMLGDIYQAYWHHHHFVRSGRIELFTKTHLEVINKLKALLESYLAKGGDINYEKSYEKKTLLHKAADEGDPVFAQVLLELGADINRQNSEGLTPLHMAAAVENEDMVKCLLSKGADHSIVDKAGMHAVHYAAQDAATYHYLDKPVGKNNCLKYLLAAGASHSCPAEKPSEPVTPLEMAIDSGNTRKVMQLVKAGADKRALGATSKDTLLHLAVKKGPAKFAMRTLRDEDVDVNARNANGDTPLHAVTACEDHENGLHNMAGLLAKDAKIELCNKQGQTPLVYAVSRKHGRAYKNQLDYVKALLDARADPNSLDTEGNRPIHYATGGANQRLMTLLLDHGADLYVRNYHGDTPLYQILRQRDKREHKKCLQKLVEMGEKAGIAPIHIAAMDGLPATYITDLAIDGADINDPGKGFTPLHWAAVAGVEAAAQTLLQLGAEPDPRDPMGATPLYHAVRQCNTAMVKTLLDHGADPTMAYEAMAYQYQRTDEQSVRHMIPDPLRQRSRIKKLRDLPKTTERRELLYALIRDNPDLNLQDENGDTLLHILCRYRAPKEDLDALLERGADPSLYNKAGESPLYVYVTEHASPALSTLDALLEWGADATSAHLDRRKSLLGALQKRRLKGKKELMSLLAEHGAGGKRSKENHAGRQGAPDQENNTIGPG